MTKQKLSTDDVKVIGEGLTFYSPTHNKIFVEVNLININFFILVKVILQ